MAIKGPSLVLLDTKTGEARRYHNKRDPFDAGSRWRPEVVGEARFDPKTGWTEAQLSELEEFRRHISGGAQAKTPSNGTDAA